MRIKIERPFKKLHILIEIFILALVFVVNFYQYINYINTTVFGRTYSFGFPFSIYEYDLMFNRGFIILEGVLGNFVFIVILGYVLGSVIQYFTKDNNLE